MTTRRILPSQKLPDIACDDPAVQRFVNREIRKNVAEVFEQFRAMVLDSDDYARLSEPNTFTSTGASNAAILISAATPNISLNETDAAVDNRRWDFEASGEALSMRVIDDALSAATAFIKVERTALVIDSVAITATVTTFSGRVRLKGFTVATLPAGTIGDTAYVTDALAPVFGAAVAGGGAVMVPVYYTGGAWFVG